MHDLIGDVGAYEVTGPSGVLYTIEADARWVDQPEGDLLVVVGIDDGGWSTFSPLAQDFRPETGWHLRWGIAGQNNRTLISRSLKDRELKR